MSLFEQLGNVWRIRDLRRKILITLGLLALCRVGVYIPVPGVNTKALADLLKSMSSTAGGQLLGIVNLFSGGAFTRGAIFGLGVMPYISASIIFTLLANVIPSLEALKKEGAAGQKKLNQYTRIATVFICFFQGAIVVRGLFFSFPGVIPDYVAQSFILRTVFMLSSGFLMMVGTLFLMWMGEQIDEHGIGNGISMIIMIGIVARLPQAYLDLATRISGAESQQNAILKIVLLLVLFLAIIVGIVYITRGERRIPVQQQKHVRGPKIYGGQKHYLPLRVNQAGVMPIIFAQALLSFPAIIAVSLAKALEPSHGFWYGFFNAIGDAISRQSDLTFTYVILYGLLLFFFTYLLDGRDVQPQGDEREPAELRQLHPRHPARQAHRRLPGRHNEPRHAGGQRLPAGHRPHAAVRHGPFRRRLGRGRLLWRHQHPDRRRCLSGPGQAHQRPPGDAALQRLHRRRRRTPQKPAPLRRPAARHSVDIEEVKR